MTPTERDRLAVMARGHIEHPSGKWRSSYFYHFTEESYPSNHWHPESSRDDCRPLFAEIERRDLWVQFFVHLNRKRNCLLSAKYAYIPSVLQWAYHQVTPADIVAAFFETIEEADGKEGEQ